MYRSLLLTGLFSVAILAGCQSTRTMIPSVVYKLEVVQGNFVSSEQVAALRAGMPRAQVKNILGTAPLTDIFHQDRWDYVFTIARNGKAEPPRKLALFFKGETLDRWEGDTMPSEADFVKTLVSGRKLEKAPPLEASQKQLDEFAKRENASLKPATAVPVAKPSQPAAALGGKTYPPLESL